MTTVARALNSTAPATSMTGPAAAAETDVRGFGSAILSVLPLVPGILYWIITFTTISLPTWLFTLFSASLTITMNATTLLFFALAIVSSVTWVVRYRYLNMYARLPSEPQRKEPTIDLYPDVPGDTKRGLSNYLDEFLSAIKVFGYLERPVFHELTRTMQTRKLVAGETILLEEEQGFCLVVDGLVQIFVKSKQGPQNQSSVEGMSNDEEDDDEISGRPNQGYQLLTEVKNGAPMSSLFSILSLFTEDVKLRHDQQGEESGEASRPVSRPPGNDSIPSTAGAVTPLSEAQSPNALSAGSPFTRQREGSLPARGLPKVPPLSLDGNLRVSDHGYRRQSSSTRHPSSRIKKDSAHPDILARATVDTTIAVIPASAFRRLTRVYPRASAHIVQVILTRLQRVTLTTGHAYLGLTSEVLRTEKLMNRYTTYDLPGYLKGSALERLKEKFIKERERIGTEESSKGIALHNPTAGRKRRSSSSLRREAAVHARLATIQPGERQRGSSLLSGFLDSERGSVSAGDLLVDSHRRRSQKSQLGISSPMHTRPKQPDDIDASQRSRFRASPRDRFPLHRQESMDEDAFYRDSITECMLKAIGLTNDNSTLRRSDSVEQSPKLVSYDARSQKAVFNNNAFGFLDAFDPSNDGESDSVVSMSTSVVSASGTSIRAQLSGDMEIVYFPKGAVLVEQGERNPGLYYVIDGFLDITVPVDGGTNGSTTAFPSSSDISPFGVGLNHLINPDGENVSANHNSSLSEGSSRKPQQRRSLYLTKPGGLAGYLGTISSRRSFVDVTAKTDVYVGFLPRASIERMVEKYPIVLLTMAKRLTSLLPRLIRHIDFALEWVQIDAGQIVFRQDDESDAIYIVLNGRLRAHREGPGGKIHVSGEYGQGDSIGELEVLTESKRPGTLKAIRDTELVKLPKTLFNSIALENPEITIKISKIIATRMRDLTESARPESTKDRIADGVNGLASSTTNFRTVAILPITSGVPVVEFSSRLYGAMSQIGTTNGVTLLNQAAILNHLGRHAFNKMGKLLLSQHLADLEEKYGLVLYVADTNVNSPWTHTCVSQADCILLVGLAEGSTNMGEFERYLVTTKTTARKELVLLHTERYCPPGMTHKWLRNRMWINGSHHHIHMAFRNSTQPVHTQTRKFGSALKQRVQVIQAEIQKYTSRKVRETPLYSADTPFKGDFHRLARRLIGKSVGLVLGGGGARGIAHIGIIRALEEAGIPIDIVGGTSIGAFVGALYAWDADVVPMYGRAKKFAGRMASMWRFALDLTYPTCSYTTGHEFNRGIFKTFGTAQIEDFWLEYYCNTVNISKSRPEVHTSGYVWRYVRASMSLAGMVPPICDENGCMLVDGGYLDNLTVEHMRSLGADVIFAIDVGAEDEQAPQNYGDSLSGFWSVFNRWNPLSTQANPPTLSEIQARLAYVSSVDALEKAKLMPGCRYMRPPVFHYGTLDFGKFDEIYQKGYEYGRAYLSDLRKKGVLPAVAPESGEAREVRRTMAPRRASI